MSESIPVWVPENRVKCPYGSQKNDNEVCDGTNHFWDFGKGYQFYRKCLLRTKVDAWAKRLSIIGGVDFASFDTSSDQVALDLVQTWCKNPQGILLLSALPGRGKTRLALGAWEEISRMGGYKVDFLLANDLAEMAIESSRTKRLDDPDADELNPMETLLGKSPRKLNVTELESYLVSPPRILILDDLGSERVTETTVEALKNVLEVLDGVLITTNFGEEELRNRYGSRIYSRLERAIQVGFSGSDYRKMERGQSHA